VPTKTIDVQEAQTNLPELLSLVAAGTEIIVTRDDMPLARLVPIEAPVEAPALPRVPGLHPGSIWTSEDFDEPLPDEFWSGTP
jgi:antitoxin (DNA-binding transcriptional repressor) of toxin-antitoxin stability system